VVKLPKNQIVHVTQRLGADWLHSAWPDRELCRPKDVDKETFPQLVERAYSDSQQRRLNNNNGPTPQPASPLAQRRNNVGLGSGVGSGAIYGTPTRV